MGDVIHVTDVPADMIDAAAAQRAAQGLQQLDMLQAIKHWSKDNIGEKLKDTKTPNFNWAFADEELTLSNIDINKDRQRISLHCAIIENDFLSSQAEETLTPNLMLQLSNIRARVLAVRAPRAHEGYERRLQATNIMQIDRNMRVVKPQGRLSRLAGRIAGKPAQEVK
jgi:hypothetical protein